MKNLQVVIITGLSGSGKSTALRALEDIGFFCVDNLPVVLLPKFLSITLESSPQIKQVALVMDLRQKSFLEKYQRIFERLKEKGYRIKILFLEAGEESLLRRFSETRRSHPLSEKRSIMEGIQAETEKLATLRQMADIVIDTSALSIHQLSTKLYEGLLGSGPTTVSVHIFSFGFKYGIPIDADFVADVRFLPNPFWVPELRSLTGKDKPVSDYVLSSEGAEEFLDAYEKAIAIAIEGYAQEDKHYVTIAFGCTGGQHRSVAMSEALAKRLRARGLTVSVSARELDKRSAD